MPDGPGDSTGAPGPSRQAWVAAFRQLAEQRGRSPGQIATRVGLGHLVAGPGGSAAELRLDQQALLADAIDVPLSVVLALAEEIDQAGGAR